MQSEYQCKYGFLGEKHIECETFFSTFVWLIIMLLIALSPVKELFSSDLHNFWEQIVH